MSELTVVWVGRRPPSEMERSIAEYEQRLSRMVRFSQVRVRPEEGRDGDPRRALSAEARRVRALLRDGDTLVVLDERGKELGSEELATWLAARLELGRLVLVVGSDLGIGDELRGLARETISLSRLTLPHHLARLVLLEQLYRALDIAAGGSYHRK